MGSLTLEDKEVGKGQASIDQKRWGFLKLPFRRRPTDTVKSIQSPHVETENVDSSEENILDIQPDEPVVEEQPKVENLRSAQRILFHTTPDKNLEGIRKSGLYMDQRDSGLAGSLIYPLYFAYEHGVERKYTTPADASADGFNLRDHTPDNYYLTVWKREDKVVKDKYYPKRYNFLKVKDTLPEGEIPPDFAEANPDKPAIGLEKIGNLPTEDLLGAIKLDKETREGVLKQIILAHIGKIDADQFEEGLEKILGEKSQLEPGVELKDLVHDLVVSLEHDIIKDTVVPEIKKAKEDPNVMEFRNTDGSVEYIGWLATAYWQAFARRELINDPVSARYLDSTKKNLEQSILNGGYDLEAIKSSFEKKLRDLRQPDNNIKGDLGESHGHMFGNVGLVVSPLRKEMGLSKY